MLQPILCFWDLTNGEECGIIKIRYCDAWENLISTDESSVSDIGEINSFRYKSYYYDSETRLYYLQSRYYDPQVGRFLNADAVDFLGSRNTIQSYNLFIYCLNNPVMYLDANGKYVQYFVGAAIGGILSALFYVIDCVVDNLKVNNWKLLWNFANGSVNGIIAATGAKVICQILTSVGNNIISVFIGSSIPNEDELVKALIIAIISGIISGVIAGVVSVGDGKHLNYLTRNFFKKTFSKFFETGFAKVMFTSFKYLWKNSKKILGKFIVEYCIPNAALSMGTRVYNNIRRYFK